MVNCLARPKGPSPGKIRLGLELLAVRFQVETFLNLSQGITTVSLGTKRSTTEIGLAMRSIQLWIRAPFSHGERVIL